MTTGPARSGETITRVAEGLVLWALAAVPAYRVLSWPSQIDTRSLLGVLAIAGILGLVAGSS
jgi:hypothetical protein